MRAGYAVVHPQLAHKDADFDVGQGGMTDDAPDLLGRRQHVLQMTPQPGSVLAVPIAMGRAELKISSLRCRSIFAVFVRASHSG